MNKIILKENELTIGDLNNFSETIQHLPSFQKNRHNLKALLKAEFVQDWKYNFYIVKDPSDYRVF